MNNELTNTDWKNIRLLERLERDLPIITVQTIATKVPVYIGKANLPVLDKRYDRTSNIWEMKSQLNGREVIYVSPICYVDTAEMKAVIYYSPKNDPWRYAVRPPFSNNIMPLFYDWSDVTPDNSRDGHYAKNIITGEETLIKQDEGYWNLSVDSDRRWISNKTHTPEYTVAIESGWCYIYVGKDHKMVPEGGWINMDNNGIINMLVSEFRGTAFDHNHILETIRTLLSSMSVVTRYGMSISTLDDARDFGYKYFFERMNKFFDTNLSHYRPIYQIRNGREYYSNPEVNIYGNGFYIYDQEKLVVLDIKNITITEYKYREAFPPDTFQGDASYDSVSFYSTILLSDDASFAFVKLDEYRSLEYLSKNWRERKNGNYQDSVVSTMHKIEL